MTDYEKQYNEAFKPDATDLIGTWLITVLSGRLPNMRRWGHIKVIKPRKGFLRGYNRILGLLRGAKFKVRFYDHCAMFLYGKIAFFDTVKKVNRDLLIGQYKFDGKDGFEIAGYFQMRRK